MRVLQLISSGGLYGAEQMMLTLARSLVQHGHDCIVGVFDNIHCQNLQVAHRASELKLSLELIHCNGRFDRKGVASLRLLLEERGIEIVHAHGYKADFYSYLATRNSGIVTVSTCHNWIGSTLATSLYGKVDRLLLRNFDGVAAVSPTVAETLRRSGVRGEKIRVINNGIDLSRFNAVGPRSPALPGEHGLTVGYVGRLSPEKGVDRLLQAAALVLARRPNTKFILAGSGPEDARLKRMAETLGLTKNVTFLSQVDEVSEVYASLDIVVLPSLTEGLPLMVLEALAAKRAVVATNVGAVPQVIIDGETGLLVAPGDANALAAGIERLMEDSSLRNRLASRGHSLVAQSYSVNVMTAGYLALYHDTVQLKHNSMNGGSKFDLSATNDAVV